MTAFTLPRRQRLSTRVPSFGGANGRGTNRVFRFGFIPTPEDAARYWALAEAGARQESPDAIYKAQNAVDWNGLYELDYARALQLDTAVHGTPRWTPAGGPPVTQATPPPVVVTPPVVIPVTPDPIPSNTVVTPGMTDAQYQAALLAAQTEALRLAAANAAAAAQAAKNQSAADAATAAEIARENVLRQNAPVPAVPVVPKSNALPGLIAAGVAFLALKG